MKKILIVDDSRFSHNTLKRFLEELEYEIIGEAVDGLDGIAKYKELHPDIIVSDIEMPNLDGIGMIQEIRSSDANVKIVISSSVVNSNLMQEVKKLKVTILTKPINKSMLHNAIELLDR